MPSTAATETGVRITEIEGRVRVKRADALMWTDASLTTSLQKGDLISTDAASTAKLQFADGSLFDVRVESLITILENSIESSRPPRVGLAIESGEVSFLTSASASEPRIETPNGRATPGSETEGNVQVSGREATVRSRKGRIAVTTRAGQRLQVGPSEAVQINADGRAAWASVLAPPRSVVAPSPDQAGIWSGVLRSPQLALDALELKGGQMHLAGRTEPDAIVTLNGVGIPVQGDGSFNEHVVMREVGTVVSVRATGTGGATTEHRLPVVAAGAK